MYTSTTSRDVDDSLSLPPELASASGYPESVGTLEIAIMQVDYDLHYREDGSEYPVIHVFGRSDTYTGLGSGDDLEHIEVRGFEPYFYVPSDSVDPEELDDNRITGTATETNDTIRGQEVTKIYTRTPRDVGQLRDDYEHYEADILFPDRFLIDKQLNSGIRVPEQRAESGNIVIHESQVQPTEKSAPPRISTFDIEVDDRNGFPEAEDAEEPIICLTSHDSYREEYILWLYDAPESDVEPPKSLDEYELLSERPNTSISIRTFDTEEMLLVNFITYLNATDPDITCGWNFDDFDATYLVNRLKRLNYESEDDLDPDRLSRIGDVWAGGWGGPNIKGRAVFDLLYAYERMQRSELDSYRLDAVGEVELDVGKERYSGDIGDLWENDPERLLEYNLRDVELCVEINEKQDIIPFWEEVRSFVGCQLEDSTTPGDVVDLYILHAVSGRFVLPSKGLHDGEDITGANVFDPITGRKENVAVLDLASLYPMCLMTLNASPETKVDPEEYEGEVYCAPNGTAFQKEPDGFLRAMIDELLDERTEKKNLRDENDPGSGDYKLYDIQQQSIKVIMNALYGVLTWRRFRLYDREMGAAVTSTGRAVLEFTEQIVNEEGYTVTYGDTDSVLLEFGEGDKDAIIDAAFALEKTINKRYDDFAAEALNADSHRFDIEFEKLYRQYFQAGKKKRYAGHIIWKEGKDVDTIDITGFEYKRSDIAPITKTVQLNTIEKIVRGSSTEEIEKYVHEEIVRFQNDEVPIEDMAMPGGIQKALDAYDTDTAQVRGAKYANLLLGTHFGNGSKPKRLYLDGVHPDFWAKVESQRNINPQSSELYADFRRNPDVICFDYPDQVPSEFRIDRAKMLDKTLQKPISRVLRAIDISWDAVKAGQTQTGLTGFM